MEGGGGGEEETKSPPTVTVPQTFHLTMVTCFGINDVRTYVRVRTMQVDECHAACLGLKAAHCQQADLAARHRHVAVLLLHVRACRKPCRRPRRKEAIQEAMQEARGTYRRPCRRSCRRPCRRPCRKQLGPVTRNRSAHETDGKIESTQVIN